VRGENKDEEEKEEERFTAIMVVVIKSSTAHVTLVSNSQNILLALHGIHSKRNT